MNTEKWIPGPWKVRHHIDSFAAGYMVETESGHPIANTMYFSSSPEANKLHKDHDKYNANLIAAAPSLYEALTDLVRFLADYEIYDRNGKSLWEDTNDMILRGEAALSKTNPQSV